MEDAPQPTEHWSRPFDAILGLGSNMGDKAANLVAAREAVDGLDSVSVVHASHLYKTAPWGVTDQDWFVNACIAVTCEMSPRDLLRAALSIEADLKRVRIQRWGPRVIDIDVLTFRNETSNDPELMLPHPRITDRAFVLAPMADFAADLTLNGKSIAEWCTAIGTDEIERISDEHGWTTL